MKAFLNYLFIFLYITNSFAQKEAIHWYYGDRLAVDFDTGKPVISTDKNPIVIESDADFSSQISISSKSGEFLFMSNGKQVWNKNFEIMENGDDILKSKDHYADSAYTFKKDQESNIYCLISTSIDALTKKTILNYSEIDMDMNNGLGKVILKSSELKIRPSDFRYFAIVKHSNGEDVWIVAHENNTHNLVSYLFTKSGLNEKPIVNKVAYNMRANYGLIFTPNTKFLIENGLDNSSLELGGWTYLNNFTYLYSFNRTTGEISSALKIGKNSLYNSPMTTSASSKFLYVKDAEYLLRYDLESNDINASEEIVYNGNIRSRLKIGRSPIIGPDKKMYFMNLKGRTIRTTYNPLRVITKYYGKKFPGIFSLATIEFPDHADPTKIDYINESISLEREVDWDRFSNKNLTMRSSKFAKTHGLPQFIPSQTSNIIFYKDICYQQETHFRLDDPVDSITWDFGEASSGGANTANGLNVSHTYATSGTYTVTATTSRDGITEILKTEVTIAELPKSPVDPVKLVQCDDDIDGFSFFNLNEVNLKISEDPELDCISFHHSIEDAQNNDNPISNTTYYKNKTRSKEILWARVQNKYGCFNKPIEINLTVVTTQIPESFKKITLEECENEEGNITFDFSQAQEQIRNIFPSEQLLEFSYFLNLQDALSELNKIEKPTAYTPEINEEKQEIFVRIDSESENDCLGLGNLISLKSNGETPKFELHEIDYICPSNPNLEISISNPLGDYNYQWTDENNQVIGNSADIAIKAPGIYSVIAISSKGCESKSKQITIIGIPQASISIEMIRITGSSFNEYTVSVNATNLEADTYEYSIDNEFDNYQDEPHFEGVSTGWHTMYVRDKEKCATSQVKFYIIGVPKFFSPNNDGINDTWNIGHLDPARFSDISIEIFDRTGLLITKIRPGEEGWDGYFNGNKMIVTDYWFTIIYKNEKQKIIKQEGNFSLLR